MISWAATAERSGHDRRVAVLAANTAWYLWNFRRETILALIEAGCRVHCFAPPDRSARLLAATGAQIHTAPDVPSRVSPLADFRYIIRLRELLADLQPSVLFTFTPKPNVLGSVAAWGKGCRHVPNISGLGRAFDEDGLLARVAENAYRFAFANASLIVFQNDDIRKKFQAAGIAQQAKSVVLLGSGVDLNAFVPSPLPPSPPVSFLFSGRLVRTKGISEYIAAATRLVAEDPSVPARFFLAGYTREQMPSTISRVELAEMLAGSPVEYIGPVEDVRGHLARTHCFVLPSYYGEGVPRSAIEAAACGRPIITTDHPGCRETVQNGETGFLVPPRDTGALMLAMQTVCAMNGPQLAAFGEKSRELAEERFDVRLNTMAYKEMARA